MRRITPLARSYSMSATRKMFWPSTPTESRPSPLPATTNCTSCSGMPASENRFTVVYDAKVDPPMPRTISSYGSGSTRRCKSSVTVFQMMLLNEPLSAMKRASAPLICAVTMGSAPDMVTGSSASLPSVQAANAGQAGAISAPPAVWPRCGGCPWRNTTAKLEDAGGSNGRRSRVLYEPHVAGPDRTLDVGGSRSTLPHRNTRLCDDAEGSCLPGDQPDGQDPGPHPWAAGRHRVRSDLRVSGGRVPPGGPGSPAGRWRTCGLLPLAVLCRRAGRSGDLQQ